MHLYVLKYIMKTGIVNVNDISVVERVAYLTVWFFPKNARFYPLWQTIEHIHVRECMNASHELRQTSLLFTVKMYVHKIFNQSHAV